MFNKARSNTTKTTSHLKAVEKTSGKSAPASSKTKDKPSGKDDKGGKGKGGGGCGCSH